MNLHFLPPVDENPSEYLLRDPGDRQRFYDDISSLKAAANAMIMTHALNKDS